MADTFDNQFSGLECSEICHHLFAPFSCFRNIILSKRAKTIFRKLTITKHVTRHAITQIRHISALQWRWKDWKFATTRYLFLFMITSNGLKKSFWKRKFGSSPRSKNFIDNCRSASTAKCDIFSFALQPA